MISFFFFEKVIMIRFNHNYWCRSPVMDAHMKKQSPPSFVPSLSFTVYPLNLAIP